MSVPVGPDRRAGRYDLEDDATTRQQDNGSRPNSPLGQRGALSHRSVSPSSRRPREAPGFFPHAEFAESAKKTFLEVHVG